jgi:protein phosphatase
MRFVPANAQHQGNRQNQQDSFGFSDPNDARFVAHGGFVAMVADGMGGLSHGDQASRTAVKTFLETYAGKLETETIPQALERSLRAANHAVFEMALLAGSPGDVGTTLIAVALHESGLHWVSVGDSAIYLFRDGTLTLLTTSHVYANMLDARVSRGEITAEQALADPQRDALTSYVGAPEISEIDRNIRPFPLRLGDAIVLASDGLFKTLPEAEIVSTLKSEGDRAPDALVRKTLGCKKEHQDNVTVCMVRAEDPSQPPAPITLRDEELPATVQLARNDAKHTAEARRAEAAAAESWHPAVTASAAPPPRSRSSRLLLMLLAVVLFGAAASYVGWRLVRTPGGSPEAVESPAPNAGADVVRPGTPVTPGSVEPVLKDTKATPPPPAEPPKSPDGDPPTRGSRGDTPVPPPTAPPPAAQTPPPPAPQR